VAIGILSRHCAAAVEEDSRAANRRTIPRKNSLDRAMLRSR
jgi:hypothetical protein